MSRTLTDPSGGSTINRVLPIHNGGSEEITAPDALQAFNGVPSSLKNQPNGVGSLNGIGKLPLSILPTSVASTIAVSGPELLYIGSKGTWTIENFDSQMDYTVTCSAGFIAQYEDKVLFTAPVTPQTVTITINDKTFDVVVDDRFIATPSILTPLENSLINNSGYKVTASAFAVQGGFTTLEVKSNTPKSDQGFGVAVDMDATGSRIIVGAYRDPYNATAVVGAVYIYRFENGAWVQEAKLLGDTQNNSDLTGYSVSMTADGSRVVFGSHGVDIDVTPDCGIAYVYVRSGTTWTREAGLTALDRLGSAQLGTAVAINADGTRILAGAPYDDNRGYGDIGAAYVFVRSGTSWTQEAKLLSPDVANGNAFGYSVTLSDDGVWAIIGAAGHDYAGAESGLFYTFYRTGSTWNYEYTVVVPDGIAGDLIGTSIDISGDNSRIAVSGAFATRDGKSQSGAVYVYYKPTTAWVLESKIIPSDLAAGDNLGWGLKLNYDGTRLVVGGNNHDLVTPMNSGKAYVFTRVGNTWTETCGFTDTDPAIGGGFGRSASISSDGTKVIVGAIGKGAPTYNFSGAAYVIDIAHHVSTDWQLDTDPSFSTPILQSLADTVNLTSWPISGLELDTEYYIRCRYNGSAYGSSEWTEARRIQTRQSYLPTTEVKKLISPSINADDWFGGHHRFSKDGLLLAVGAHGTNTSGVSNAGRVYLYSRATLNDDWTLLQTIVPSVLVVDDYFGLFPSFSDDNTRLIVSAHAHTEPGIINCGCVYVFVKSGATYVQEAKLLASDRAATDLFGNWARISGDGTRIIASAYLADVSGQVDAGAVYIFSRSGSTWTQEQKITLPSPFNSDQFGTGVAIDTTGTRIAVGCHLRNVASIADSGLVVTYTRSGTTWTLEASLINSDSAATDYFGSGLAMTPDGTRLAIGCVYKDTDGVANSGAIYVFTRSGSTWTQEAKLVTSDKVLDDYFGNWYGIAISDNGDIIAGGCYNKDVAGLTNAGAAYLFKRVGNLWYQEAILTASDKAANDQFAQSVSMTGDGSVLALGSLYTNTLGVSDSGALYIFQ